MDHDNQQHRRRALRDRPAAVTANGRQAPCGQASPPSFGFRVGLDIVHAAARLDDQQHGRREPGRMTQAAAPHRRPGA